MANVFDFGKFSVGGTVTDPADEIADGCANDYEWMHAHTFQITD